MRCIGTVSLALLAATGPLTAGFVLPGRDSAETGFSHAGAVSFNSGPGSLAISDITFDSLLSPPISSGGSLTASPVFGLRATMLRFEKIPTSVIDDTLRSVSAFPAAIDLGALFLFQPGNTGWIHGLWAGEQLASDFRNVESEDFSTNAAGFSGYRFNDKFTFGAGIGVEYVDDEIKFHPGIGIDWRICDPLRLEACGAKWALTYTRDDPWNYSIRGDNTGEIWNLMDKGGETLSLSVSSFRIGLFASRRLTDKCWLDLGIGTTFGNEVRLRDTYGESVVKEGMQGGVFTQINLTIKSW